MPRYICASTFLVIAGLVLWPGILMPKGHALAESIGPDGSNAQALHELGQIGRDVNVGLISSGNARTTHEAFQDTNGISHASDYDFSGGGILVSSHDTWMAGIVASRGGVSNPNDIGVAPGSNIHTARVVDSNGSLSDYLLENALDELIVNQNCRVIMTGFAIDPVSVVPDGQSQWSRMYDYYAYHYNVVFANAAANTPSRILVFGDAFNGITTAGLAVTDPDVYGRVGSESGAGPTDDNRRKPEVAGPSQNQTMPSGASDTSWYTWTSGGGATSLSVPHTAGVAALLLSLADETPDPNDNKNEVIRAVIVNSTFPNINDRDNNSTNPADPNNVWHSQRGYGRIDAFRAYQLLGAEPVPIDANITGQKGWAYKTIGRNGQPEGIDTYRIAGLKNHRLALTVTWNRRININGSTYTEEAPPRFNLDLTILDPNGQTLFSETDSVDNMEKVDLILPAAGVYEISLTNTSSKQDRAYGLAFELLPPIPGDFEPLDYIVDYGDLDILSQKWLFEDSDLEPDIRPNGRVDLADFALFAQSWLETDAAYYQQP